MSAKRKSRPTITVLWGQTSYDEVVQVETDDRHMLQIPSVIAATAETDAYLVTIRTGLDETLTPQATELHVVSKSPAHIPPVVLDGLNLGELINELVDRTAQRFTLSADGRSARRDRDSAVFGVKGAHEWARRKGRRPEPDRIDAEVEEVAKVARATPPGTTDLAFVVGQLHMTRRTAQRRLQAARERGLIEED
jgi:hypothetical protein